MAYVYWIHLPEHTDILTEGYIGYTSRTVDERWKGHLKECKRSRNVNYPVYRAIAKYGAAILVTTLLEGSEEYCLDVENKLRPSRKIGWNLQEGGNKGTKGVDVTPETRAKISAAGKGRVFSEEHRRKLSEVQTGRVMSEDTKAKMSEQRSGIPRSEHTKVKHSQTLQQNPWRNSKAIKEIWVAAQDFYSKFAEDTSVSLIKFSRSLSVGECRLKKMLSKFKEGWVPEQDTNWLQFVEQYNKEHRESAPTI